MNNKIGICCAISCGLFIFSGRADAITLAECKALSLRNSKLLASYEDAIKASLYAHRKDTSALLPQLSAFYGSEFLQFSHRSEFTHGSQDRIGLALSYDLQKLLVNYPRLSHLELEKNRLVKAVAEQEVQKDLTQEYYKLFVLLEKQQEYAGARSFIAEHIKDIERLRARGMEVRLDLMRAKVQLTSLYMSISNVNGEIENALIALNSMMGTTYTAPDFASMDATDMAALKSDQAVFEENTPEVSGEDSYLERVETQVPQNIPSLEQSGLNAFDVKIAKASYQRSQWYFVPSLQVWFEHNLHTVDPNVEAYKTSVVLNFDVFDLAQKATEERQLKYSYESHKKLFEENQRKLTVRIEQLITEIENVKTTYKYAIDNVASAEKSLDTAKEYFQQGKIKETDLLSVFSDYLNTKDQSYEMLYSFLSKKAELDALIKGMEG